MDIKESALTKEFTCNVDGYRYTVQDIWEGKCVNGAGYYNEKGRCSSKTNREGKCPAGDISKLFSSE